MEQTLKVIKRDGTLETFDKEKIIRIVITTGLEQSQAEHLAKEVEHWAYSLGKNPIPSIDMRIHILSMLQKIKPYSAGLYEWYEKTKHGKTG